MNLSNREIRSATAVLFSIGERLPVRKRWELSLFVNPLAELNNLINEQINQIINKNGEENEKGELSIKTDDPELSELLECESDVPMDYIPLDLIESASIPEMILLKKLIREKG